MRELAEKVVACCRHLSTMTEIPGCTTRTFLSPPMHEVHEALSAWMCSVGMNVRVDAVGNLRGLYGNARAPRLVIASHLDTVPNAGAFDGILGVVMGIALVETQPDMAIEVIGFSEEEGVKYGFPFIGSRAFVGTLGTDLEIAAPAIRAFGLDPADIDNARYAPETIAYLEFHIEQGPVLESLNLPLGVVENIVGQSRYQLTFTGKANHAGTTPMHLRHDALAAAAEWVLEVECAGVIATVGSLQVLPNAANAIPGEVRASLDLRHASDAIRHAACERMLHAAAACGEKRGVAVRWESKLDQPAVPMDAGLRARLPQAHLMDSGAGHDAMIVAPHIPSAMLFLRSPGGISHHPDESVLVEDVEAALEAGAQFIGSFGNG
jgi:allantoate deiminase